MSDSTPAHWREVLLDDVTDEVTVGYVGSMTKEYVETGIPWLRNKNVDPFNIDWDDMKYVSEEFHKKLRKSSLSPGDVVIVRTGKPGAAALIPDSLTEANCSDLVIVRCGEELDKRFCVYYLNSTAKHHIHSHLVGAVQQHFNVGAAKKLKMQLPPLEEQRAIASILGALDDKIELNRRMNATLESLARAIFKSWFVDFDPVKINAGQMPANSAIPTTHDPKVLDLFPSTFQDSELGPIPEGWTIKSIEEIADVKSGKRLPKGHRLAESPTPFPYLRGVDVENGRFNPADVQYLSEETQERISKYIVNTNDVVLTIVGTIGRVIFIDPQWNGANLTENAARITNVREGGSRLIFQYLSSPKGQDDIRSRIAGSVQGKLPLYQIKAIKLAIPNRSLSAEFERIAASIDDVLVRNLAESADLSRTRDALLPVLLSGELPVAELIETEP